MEGDKVCTSACIGASPISCEHQCFDSSRVACCYFSRSDDARDKLTKNAHYPVGQGILFQLYSDCNQARDEASDRQLIILTSHQLVSSLSTARDWVLGFCETKKQFSLASYIDQQQVRVITCCGSIDGESLWDCGRTHLETMCPMRSDCSILLLGAALTRDILSEFSASLCIFTIDDIMPLKSAEGVLLSGSTVTVYHRTGSGSVLSSQFQMKKPHTKVDSSFLLSTQVEWYLENCSTLSYEKTAPLSVTGAPIIYREPNSGKPLLLGMHVYLEFQNMQYGVSIGHILELLQCKHIFGPQFFYEAPHSSHIPKLSLLRQAVQHNICSPCYYENISSFLDDFGCILLELPDLFQINHYIASTELLFAQSELISDDVGVRRASLLLVEALYKLFKQFDKGIPEATVDGVESWCPYLTIKDIQEGFATLCNQLAFCILGNVENEDMVQTWSNCWSSMLYLNGLVIYPILQYQLFSMFHKCQFQYPNNAVVQKCYGEIMSACYTAQFHKLNMVETQQVEQNHEMRQAIAKLQEKVEQHDAAIEMQPTPQLSEMALVQKLQEQENTIRILKSVINKLQTELSESEKSRRELQEVLRGQYHIPTAPIVLSGLKKERYSLEEEYKDSTRYMRNGRENNFASHATETDDPGGIEKDSANALHTTSQARPSTLKSQTSLPSTPPPRSIPPSMQRRTMSASGARTSNNTSSSFVSSTPVPGDQNVGRFSYQQQMSFTSSTSSESSGLFATPLLNTPDGNWSSVFDESTELKVLTRQTSMEVVYKQLVRDNFSTFTKQTDMSSISSLLIQKKLMSHDEYECMVRRTDKSHYFYTSVLPGKGDGAYTLLRQCIKEETDHRGHMGLNELFFKAES